MTNISECKCYCELQHEQHTDPTMRALERDVLGCDFGGTSWTTKSQADLIPPALGLTPDSHLLEIGAGTGWPGLYLACKTGCEVTLLDIPVSTLVYANQRAVDENIENLCHAVAASGAALPFASSTFETIGHSDVLCCLPQKPEMLRECRRVACDGAKMLFYVIAPTRGLRGNDLKEACEAGPPFVGVPDDYDKLLIASGWNLLEKTDLTRDYLHALSRLVAGLETQADELQQLMGTREYVDQIMKRRLQVDAIERGLLEREMFLVQAV
jgi:ubiquinone/menaquinone biosynthesis C-methylase UbiE